MRHVLLGLALGAVAAVASAGDAMSGGFKDLDTNADGSLSSAEVSSQATLSADFSTADSNGDGSVTEAEYDAWMAAQPSATAPSTPSSTTAPSMPSSTTTPSTPAEAPDDPQTETTSPSTNP